LADVECKQSFLVILLLDHLFLYVLYPVSSLASTRMESTRRSKKVGLCWCSSKY